MLRRKFFVALAILVGFALAAAPVSLAQGQTLTIGVIGPADGPTLRGVSLAVEHANAGGMILPDGSPFTVRVVAVDAGDQVAAAIQQLQQNNVLAVFGPDDNAIAARNLSAMSAAGIPVFTAATSSEVQTGGFVFRTRASDATRMAALADFLLTDLGAQRFAIYQGSPAVASQTSAVVVALAMRSVMSTPVLQDPARPVAEAAAVLLQEQPDCIVAFGEPDQLAELYQALKSRNYTGTFATDQADNRAFISALPPTLRGDIYGTTAWTFAFSAPATADFLQAYVSAYSELPGALSAAAYDAASALIQVIQQAGPEPGAILAAMQTLPALDSLQGRFDPTLGNGETTVNSIVVRTNQTGAPTLAARFEGTERLPLTAEVVPTLAPTVALPPTLPPPPPTPVPTATPEGVIATVISDVLNVRYGPGVVYAPPIGRLRNGEQVRLLGVEPTYNWATINFQGRQAWISLQSNLVSVFGDLRSLPFVPVPPTPTPAATATPTVQPLPDLVLINAFLTPPILQSGQPFTLTMTIGNVGGANAGPFAIAAAFDPGGVYGAVNLPGLAAGQQTTAVINYPGVVGVGTFRIAIVLDLNNEVWEGEAGEANNKPEITYQVQ